MVSRGALPPRLYTDPEWFQLELNRLAECTWQFLGLTDELANDGDWLRRTLLGRNVFVQNSGGELQGFLNVCSHRGFPLRCGDSGNGIVQCGFHGWVYDSRGVPVGIPRNAELFQLDTAAQEALALPRVRLQTAGRFVFVAFGNGPSPLREYLGAYVSVLDAVSFRMSTPFFHDQTPTAANWKLCMEVTFDDYHPPTLHPTTLGLGELKPHQFFYRRDGLHSCFLKRRDPDWTFETYWRDLDSGILDTTGYKIHQVFPNFLLAILPDSTIFSRYEPAADDRTTVETYRCDWAGKTLDDESRRASAEEALTFLREDRTAAERQQVVIKQRQHALVLGALEERVGWFHEALDSVMRSDREHSS
jgi:choline monooxygenase